MSRVCILIVALVVYGCGTPSAAPSEHVAMPVAEASALRRGQTAATPLPSVPTGGDPALPAPLSMMSTAAVGTIASTFTVTGGGAANYALLVEMPPGRRGLQPDLSLQYSSRRGNGVVGVGWSISGIASSIAVCGRDRADPSGSVAPVTWDPKRDRLCLDGKPLVQVNGRAGGPAYGHDRAIYATERDSFSKVVQTGSPAKAFTVYTKTGNILTYGVSDGCPECSTNIMARDSVRRAWPLTALRDRYENSMFVFWSARASEYADDPNVGTLAPYGGPAEHTEYVPYSVRYGGTSLSEASRELRLIYESTRPDTTLGWMAGTRLENKARLSRIVTSVDGRVVRSYALEYRVSGATGRSLLANVRECAGDGTCKPRTYFEYSAGKTAFKGPEETQILAPPTELPATQLFPATPLPIIAGDVNGDGKVDLIYPMGPANASANTSDYYWTVLRMGSDGMANASVVTTSIRAVWPFAALPFDYNQDGRTDLLLLDHTTELRVLVANASGDDFALQTPLGKDQAFIGINASAVKSLYRYNKIADFDGDGRQDLLTCEELQSRYRWRLRLPVGRDLPLGIGGTSDCRLDKTFTLDTDGDGAVELMLAAPAAATYSAVHFEAAASVYARVTDLPKAIPQDWNSNKARTVDLNRDGLLDVLAGHNAPAGKSVTIQYWLSRGNGRFDGGQYGYPAVGTDFGQYARAIVNALVVDHNGDGFEDLLINQERGRMHGCGGRQQPACPAYSDNWSALINKGKGAWPPAETFQRRDTGVRRYCYYGPGFTRERALDENGDMLPDLVFVDTAAAGSSQTDPCFGHPGQFMFARHDGAVPDLLVKVRDGLLALSPDSPAWADTVSLRIDYSPATSPSVYRDIHPGDPARTGCVYPVSCSVPRLMLVKQTQHDRGDGHIPARMSYNYYDGRSNVTGRGFLGFGARTSRDVSTAALTLLRYDNRTAVSVDRSTRYPFAGLITSKTITTTNAIGVSIVDEQNAEYAERRWAAVYPYSAYSPYFPALTRSVTTRREGGLVVRRLEKTYERDAYDQVTCEMTDFSSLGATCARTPPPLPGHEWRLVRRTYRNDPSRWLLGLVEQKTITDTSGIRSLSQRRRYFYDPRTGALNQMEVEPDDARQRVVIDYRHNQHGNVEQVTAVSGAGSRRANIRYDAEGVFPLSFTNAAGHTTKLNFDRANGTLLTIIDTNALVTQQRYDGFGRLRQRLHPDGNALGIWYSGAPTGGGVVSARVGLEVTGAGTTTFDYDRLGRLLAATYPGFKGATVREEVAFDDVGRVASRSRPFFEGGAAHLTHVEYDNLNRPLKVVYADGATSRRVYDGMRVDSYDPLGNQRSIRRDSRGQVIEAHDPSGVTTYSYGPFESLRGIVDASGSVTTLETDNYGRVTSLQEPNTGAHKFEYDAFGQSKVVEDAVGGVMSYDYDALGRIIERRDPDGVSTFEYDSVPHGLGHLSSAVRSRATNKSVTSFAFDELSRVTKVTRSLSHAAGEVHDFVEARAYGPSGNLASVATDTPEGRFGVAYGYDAVGNLIEARDFVTRTPHWTVLKANADGQVEAEAFGNGVVISKRHDTARGWLTGLSSTPSAVQDLAFTYDAAGNMTHRGDRLSSVSQRFRYTPTEQVAQVWDCESGAALPCPGPERVSQKYRYDAIGNITRDSLLGARTFNPSRPQLMTSVAGDVFTYDANGNMETRPKQRLSYTTFGKLSRVETSGTPSPTATEFIYDAFDARVSKTTGGSRSDYVGGAVERAQTDSGVTTHFRIAAGGRTVAVVTRKDAAEEVRYFHDDHIGSVNVVTGPDATIVGRYAFGPYGQSLGPTWLSPEGALATPADRSGFTGHHHDPELGLVNMQGRIYDPRLGRFLTGDPYVQAPFDGRSLNRYSYVWNNPLTLVDPSGYEAGYDEGHEFTPETMPDDWGTTFDVDRETAGYDDFDSGDQDLASYDDGTSWGYDDSSPNARLPDEQAEGERPSVVRDLATGFAGGASGEAEPPPDAAEQAYEEWHQEHWDPIEGYVDYGNDWAGELVLSFGTGALLKAASAGVGTAMGAAWAARGAGALRATYVSTAEELGAVAGRLRAGGTSAEEAVRTISPLRNELKLNIRERGSWLASKAADLRNLAKYGNRAGPSADDLFRQYGSWDKALEAISRTNTTVNRLTGVGP